MNGDETVSSLSPAGVTLTDSDCTLECSPEIRWPQAHSLLLLALHSVHAAVFWSRSLLLYKATCLVRREMPLPELGVRASDLSLG